jgi:hypothetical protein
MEQIERAAEVSVARATGFAALGIAVAVLGLSFDLLLALRTGAVLTLMLAVTLGLSSLRASSTPYKRTEAWLLLDPRPSLPPDIAQALIAAARRAAFERYARRGATVAVIFWVTSILVQLV